MSLIENFEPRPLWHHFDEILKIPRGSKEEEQMRQYVTGVAKKHGLEYRIDGTGNVVVRKPGSPGHEGAPTVILQAHLDMVNEKNSDVVHDFTKDPIQVEIDGEYLKAKGTTLGSDNGIGVAAMLAVLESRDLAHGPLELLFTVDEETGLTGAAGLAEDLLEGRILLNLDSEDEGVLTIGCAGGADTRLALRIDEESRVGAGSAYAVELAGLKGGHSGIDIDLGRGNALQLLVRALRLASDAVDGAALRVAELSGGNMHNAIPREARAVVVVETGRADVFAARLEEELGKIRQEYHTPEPELRFAVESVGTPARTWTESFSTRALDLLLALPHGVVAMSRDIPGLVETSTNLATASRANGELGILLSSRSSVATALDALRGKIRAAAHLAGAHVEEGEGYPGWQPNVDSPLLETVKSLHHKVLGTVPEVTAVHAGLECGIIGEKYSGMDMISFGPQIENPHSPDERVKVGSVDDFFRLLSATLEDLAS